MTKEDLKEKYINKARALMVNHSLTSSYVYRIINDIVEEVHALDRVMNKEESNEKLVNIKAMFEYRDDLSNVREILDAIDEAYALGRGELEDGNNPCKERVCSWVQPEDTFPQPPRLPWELFGWASER